MTDEEILDKYIDLSNSDLTLDEKETLMNTIKEHKQAFSLRDEIGQYPNIKIDIDVIDDSPFFVRPFPIHEEDKPIMDSYMAKLVSLGILTKNNTTHTSPVMLVSRKGTKNERPVVDFRLLNTSARGLVWYTGYQHKFMSINSIRRYSSTGAVRINPGHGTKIARGLVWYTGYQHKFMSINSIRRYSSTGAVRINPGHGTKIARG